MLPDKGVCGLLPFWLRRDITVLFLIFYVGVFFFFGFLEYVFSGRGFAILKKR